MPITEPKTSKALVIATLRSSVARSEFTDLNPSLPSIGITGAHRTVPRDRARNAAVARQNVRFASARDTRRTSSALNAWT